MTVQRSNACSGGAAAFVVLGWIQVGSACGDQPLDQTASQIDASVSEAATDAAPPIALSASTDRVQAVAAGWYHSCALLRGGMIKCWGMNASGQLGIAGPTARGDNAGEMGDDLPFVNLGDGVVAKAISAGSRHTCAIVSDDSVRCWGANDFGQLGQGDKLARGASINDMGRSLAAINLGTGITAKSIAAGGVHTCALLNDGAVKCWGANHAGQLGLGDASHRGDEANEMGDALQRVDLGLRRTAKAIASGGAHTCAILDDDTVKCWGANLDNQLGLAGVEHRGANEGEMGDSLLSVNLGNIRVLSIAAGDRHTCAILEGGALKCWGANDSGQLGLGDHNKRGDSNSEMGDALSAVRLGTGRIARAVAAVGGHTCALLDNGAVKCFGNNEFGQLGLGDTKYRGLKTSDMGDALPNVDLGEARIVTSLVASSVHTCAVLNNDAVKCWGGNGFGGELGLGDKKHRGDNPGEMGDLLPVVDLGQ